MSTQPPAQPVRLAQSAGAINVGAQAQALVNNVVNLARKLGETDSADLLAGHATSADTTATIVVAGEAKQGKSSLINSLLGLTGLSPVHADIATAVPLRIRYGPETTVTLTLTDNNLLKITPDELPGWVCLAKAELDQLRQVRAADLAVPSALLEPGIVLLDTPGVGGLVAGHAKMTQQALKSATALLFVTDADTKLTRPELEFLAIASERIAAVLFAITKIDATPDWQRVLDEDREVLQRYAPRYANAPMVGVSARLATQARDVAQTDKQLNQDLFKASGVGQLRNLIQYRIRPRAETAALANTVALSLSTLELLKSTAQRNLAAATGGEAFTTAYETEKARVAELRREDKIWGTKLERLLFNARTALRESVKSSAGGLHASGERLVKSFNGRDASQIVAQIDANLEAQAQDLAVALNHEIGSICAEMLRTLNIASPPELSVAGFGDVDLRQFEPNSNHALNVLTAGMTAFMGHSVTGALAGALGLTAGVFIALPLIGAAGLGYAVHHVRGGATRRTELAAWVRAETARAVNDRYADIERGLTSAKLDITDVIRAGLIEREREATAGLEAAAAARTQSQKERNARAATNRSLHSSAAGYAATAEELLRVLLNAITAPNTAGTPQSRSAT